MDILSIVIRYVFFGSGFITISIMLLHKQGIKVRFLFWIGKVCTIVFLASWVLFLTFLQNEEFTSFKKFLISSVSSPHLMTLLPLFYFILKVPTKDDFNRLREEVRELRGDFKEHMKQYHQK